jgi:hypothetical protein
MVNHLYDSINKYFNRVTNVGYVSQPNVEKMLLFVAIQELLENDFRAYVSEKDYGEIENALYCLYGTTCLIPFPDYYTNKNKRVMYTGSMSENAHRIEILEKEVEEIKWGRVPDKDIVVPGFIIEDNDEDEDIEEDVEEDDTVEE